MVRSLFLRSVGLNHNLSLKITSLKTFVPIFLDFLLDQGNSFPLTFSSFVMGAPSYTLESGLSFEVATFAHDSDEEKIKEFITHPYFEFYKNAALKYGFYIDMNAPWRLVANLSSPAMQKFMSVSMGSVNVGPLKYFSNLHLSSFYGRYHKFTKFGSSNL